MMCRTVLRARAQGRENEERRQKEKARTQADEPREHPGEQRGDLTEPCDNKNLSHGLIGGAATGSDMKRGGQWKGRADPDARRRQSEHGNRRAVREQKNRRTEKRTRQSEVKHPERRKPQSETACEQPAQKTGGEERADEGDRHVLVDTNRFFEEGGRPETQRPLGADRGNDQHEGATRAETDGFALRR